MFPISPLLPSLLSFGAAVLLLLACESSQAPRRGPSSYDPEKIYVHLVPHTHDDVGWLKTVDEYYTGGNRTISYAAVKYILDSVVEELQKDAKRTFIYVEMAFFARWWREQTDDMRNIVKKLVSTKQLEFINGGWCMNDEASTHYNAIIDQMSLGLQFLESTFGPEARPRIAWQIDPFGHSNTQAALFAAMGFDGLFFGRQDYDDHAHRINESRLQMVWQPSQSLGASADLFTGVMYAGYGQPPGFCFDAVCQNDLIQDDPNLYDYNVDSEVDLLMKEIYRQANASATNHIMFTFGSDFQYMNARMNFDNMDKLIKYTNLKNALNSSVEIFYSTPSTFLDALHEAGKTWTVKKDDFFPYADGPYSYWTGYFTSRPALKGYVREMNNLLQTCMQIEALGFNSGKFRSEYSSIRLQAAMGVAQHHDAVSGTEKQHVAYDYAKRLSFGAEECSNLIGAALAAHLEAGKGRREGEGEVPMFETCPYLNVSICSATESNNFNVILYNPLGRAVSYPAVFPLTTNEVLVYDEKGERIPAQVTAVSEGVARARGKRGTAEYEVYFNVDLPALGFKTFFVREGKINSSSVFAETQIVKTSHLQHAQEDIIIKGDLLTVMVDGESGRLKLISKDDGHGDAISLKLDQNFYWYNSSDGRNKNSTQASGAYIFRPNSSATWNVNGSDTTIKVNVIKGPLFEEVQQTFTSWVQQNIRVHKLYPFVEFDFIVGPIPINDNLGKEIITRYTSAVKTDGTCYTDANGREMQKRVRNYRPTWKLNVTEPVAGNYYPVNSRIFMQYEDAVVGPSQFTVMTDRSQGGASLNDGQLELMLHRRTLYDDARGVGEPMNETGVEGAGLVIRGRHYALLGNITSSTVAHRTMGEGLMLKPYSTFVRDATPPKTWIGKYQTEYTTLKAPLPENVHLLTVKLLEDRTYQTLLLRLEHQFEAHESPFNDSVSVSLTELFPFEIDSLTELSLAANAEVPLSRLQWTTSSDEDPRRKVSVKPVTSPDYTVELTPMQIRTFTVKIHS